MLEKFKTTKIGQAFVNLYSNTTGFKSSCVATSYACVETLAMVSLAIVILIIVIFGIGTFTSATVNGEIFIEVLKLVKDILITIVTFFAIAVTTTFGATAFGSSTPSGQAKVDNQQNEN